MKTTLIFLSLIWSNLVFAQAGTGPIASNLTGVISRTASGRLTNHSDTAVTTLSSGQALVWNGSSWVNQTVGSGSGSVTSVAISGPPEIHWANSPITSSGTLTGTTDGSIATNGSSPTFDTVIVTNITIQNNLTVLNNIVAKGNSTVNIFSVTNSLDVTNNITGWDIFLTNGLTTITHSNNTSSTVTTGLQLTNNVVATVGSQKVSPSLEFAGAGWKTAATAGSQPVKGRIYLQPVQDTTSPDVGMIFQTSTNGSAYQTVLGLSSYGDVTNTRNVYFGNGGSITGPNGTSTTVINDGSNQEIVFGSGGAVDLFTGGSTRMHVTSAEWQPPNLMDLGDGTHRFRVIHQLDNVQLASDQTVSSASLTTTTLAMTLTGTFNYGFEFSLLVADSVGAEGIQVDLNGGTATWTDIRYSVQISDTTGVLKTAQNTSLITAVGIASITGDTIVTIRGSGHCSGSGTLTPRFAQNSHSTGTATCYKNSYGFATSMP